MVICIDGSNLIRASMGDESGGLAAAQIEEAAKARGSPTQAHGQGYLNDLAVEFMARLQFQTNLHPLQKAI